MPKDGRWIMDCLATLGLTEDAGALQRCLVDDVARVAGARITPRTLSFWRGAL